MEQIPPSSRMMGLINSYMVSQALHVAATLGVADLLKDGPRCADDLAMTTNTQPDALYRLLRALAAIDVLDEQANRCFALTEMGECLREDAPEPVAAWAVNIGQPYVWAAGGALLHSVRSGESGFLSVHGTDPWNYRTKHSHEAAVFDRAMAELSRRASAGVVAAYSFREFGRIVDVGGGNGALLATILKANPHAHGVLFDQPHVIAGSAPVLAAAGVADRCECIGGSFFEAVPPGCDVYMLKSVLHDWDNEQAISILRKCRAAMPANGRLLVVERVVGPPNEQPAAKLADLNMLVMLGARERTQQEFAELFDAANFTIARVVSASLGYCIIEGTPS
jgi:hypothetical protein